MRIIGRSTSTLGFFTLIVLIVCRMIDPGSLVTFFDDLVVFIKLSPGAMFLRNPFGSIIFLNGPLNMRRNLYDLELAPLSICFIL